MKISSPDTQQFIEHHLQDNIRSLALQKGKYPDVDLTEAITQIAGYQVAQEKIPTWAKLRTIVYPRHLSLEQCSSEATALYKASLVEGNELVDLTGGFGIDCSFMAQKFKKATYVEQQTELCDLATHNFKALNLGHIRVVNSDSVEFLKEMSPVDTLFIDPARRNEHGGKTVAISDCEPNVGDLEDLLLQKAPQVMIKLSPMLDMTLATRALKRTTAIHILSVNNECKELLFILQETPEPTDFRLYCTNITSAGEQPLFSFTRKEEAESECLYTDQVKNYLFEPNASILKAGAYRKVAETFELEKLHPNSHLYTSDEPNSTFPGRKFQVEEVCGFNKKELKQLLGHSKKANLTIRNFPSTVAELRKRLKIGEGGDVYLFATTLANEQKVLIRCKKI